MTGAPDRRREQLAAGLARTRDRIEAACAAADRDPADVRLIVVTKTWPASDILALAELGVTDVGENKAGELQAKRAECAEDSPAASLTWHFIGQIQSNKARDIAAHADVVHAVDRAKLLAPLAQGRRGRDDQGESGELACLVQVSLDPEPRPGRGGVGPDQAPALADEIAATDGLRLRGVMGIAPLDDDPGTAFALLRDVGERIAASHPEARWMSAGMSGDLEQAVLAGATHLRVGSAILGSRPPLG